MTRRDHELQSFMNHSSRLDLDLSALAVYV
jgi:hypothetical protein